MNRAFVFGLMGLGLAAFVTSASGCGSSSKGDANPAAANNGGGGDDTQQPAGDDGSSAGSDAGSTVDPHSVYPAPHPAAPRMHNSGGRVIGTPNIVTVTFDNMDPSMRDDLRAFDDEITHTGYWETIMDGYGVGDGHSGGWVELPDTFSNNPMADGDLQTWLQQQITANVLPPPNDDTIYVLYLPQAASITLQGGANCSSYGGYHFSSDVTLNAKSQRFYYAVIADCSNFGGQASYQDTLDMFTVTTSHELAEAATDPDVDRGDSAGAYYMMGNDAWTGLNGQRGGEVGDVCENYSGTTAYSWSVQTIWNQKAADESRAPCQPAGSNLYFAAIPHTQVPGQTIGGAPTSDGYIVAEAGKTTTVEVDVFSTQPVAEPFTIVAGRGRAGSSSDPTKVNPPMQGVTMSMSQSTAVNGDTLTLSITVAANVAHKSTSRGTVVRAVRNAKEYHSWPVIIYVP